MFAEAGLLEDILQALLAPPAARLGRSTKRVDQVPRLVADLTLPRAHQVHGLAQPGIMVDALLLDRLELLLIGLQQRFDRRDRSRELLPRLLEEGLARIAEQLVGDVVKLRRQAFLGVL